MQAEECKAKGNEAFAKKDYETAIDWYTKAIAKDGTQAAYYSNRSASLAEIGSYDQAVEDGEMCIQLRPTWEKGYFRKVCGVRVRVRVCLASVVKCVWAALRGKVDRGVLSRSL